MRYKIKLYNTYNSLSADYEFTDESELYEIQEIRQDGDKFIDEEFFSFEAKKLSLAFVPNESPCAIKLKEYIECNDFIVRNYPPTDDGYVAPSISTSFINRRIEIWIKEDWEVSFKLLFSGFPDVSSFSRDYKTNTYKIDLASVYYVFFDNIEEMSELNIFNSYLMRTYGNQCSGEIGYFFEANNLLNDFIEFYRSNGINLSAILSKQNSITSYINLNAMPIYVLKDSEDFGIRVCYEKLGILPNKLEHKNITLRGAYSDYVPNPRCIYDSYVKTKNAKQIKIVFIQGGEGDDPVEFFTNKLMFKSSTTYILKENFLFSKKEESCTFEQIEYVKNVLSSYQFVKKVSVSTGYNNGDIELVTFEVRPFTGQFTDSEKSLIGGSVLTYLDLYMSSKESITNSTQSFIIDNITYTFFDNIPKILATGSYLSKIKIKSQQNNLGGYDIVTAETNGILNPDSFSAKDFLKYLLILSGTYMRHRYYSNVSDIDLSKNFTVPIYANPDDEPQFPNEADITDFSCKKIFINLNKEFSDMDFSETDHRFLIRGLLYSFKIMAGSLQSVFNLSILKSSTYMNTYNVGGTMRKPSGERYYINSIEIEEDLMNLEIILLTTLLQ